MLQLRFAPRFSAAIRAGQKAQTFRLGAPRAQPGMPIQLIESGSGRLLLNSWILEVQPATIRRCVSCEGKPKITGIQLSGRELDIGQHDTFAALSGFGADEPGCANASEAMARFFATIYPGTELCPEGATLHGHLTVWAGVNDEARVLRRMLQPGEIAA